MKQLSFLAKAKTVFKIFLTYFILFYSTSISGQLKIKGTIRDYQTKEIRPYAFVVVDTIDTFMGTSIHKPICSTTAKENGTFSIETKYKSNINVLFIDYEHVTVTIKNIILDNKNQEIDLGDIYVPYRGLWIEGYKTPDDQTKKDTRKLARSWRKNKEPVPTNWAGFSNDFFKSYKGMENITLEYPIHSTKKEFQIKDETLIIDYKEFNRINAP